MTISFDHTLDKLELGGMGTNIHKTSRKFWYRYCYHFSHVKNIISILEDGRLLSRNKAILENKMSQDNASEKIIEQTDSLYKNYVRLYFRPKTPTQYHNEGVKTEEQLAIS